MEVNLLPWKLIYLHGPWKFSSMQANLLSWELPWKSVEVDLLPWKKFPCKLVVVDVLPWKLVEASMEIHGTVGGSGSFHCLHQRQLPPIYSVEASMRFHILLHTFMYLQ